MIREIFSQRRRQFQKECLKYLRYVLNDHFVLFLMFFGGFLMVQYSELLKNPPKNPYPFLIISLIISFALPFLGSLATFVDESDCHYLLVKEREVVAEVDRAYLSSLVFGSIYQTVALGLVAPLLFTLGLPLWALLVLAFVLVFLRLIFFRKKHNQLKLNTGLDWDLVIAGERKHRQRILSFFALFTQVKGLTTSVRRRAYFDAILAVFSKSRNVWLQLYVRAFLRSGDYLGLALRLLGLALAILCFLPEKMLAIPLALLLNYLLLFQLLGLNKTYDYQYLTKLFPLDNRQKIKGLKSFLRYLAYFVVVVELVLVFDLKAMFVLLLGQIFLVEVYLAYKLKKIVD